MTPSEQAACVVLGTALIGFLLLLTSILVHRRTAKAADRRMALLLSWQERILTVAKDAREEAGLARVKAERVLELLEAKPEVRGSRQSRPL